MEGALGCRRRSSSRMDRTKQSWWRSALLATCLWSSDRGHRGEAGVHDGSARGDIPRGDAPKRVWRRETLHTLEGRASACPNTSRRVAEPVKGRCERHPPRNARDAGTRHGSHGWQTLVVFILVFEASSRALTRSGAPAHSSRRARAKVSARRKRGLHPGRCRHVERRRKGERVAPLIMT